MTRTAWMQWLWESTREAILRTLDGSALVAPFEALLAGLPIAVAGTPGGGGRRVVRDAARRPFVQFASWRKPSVPLLLGQGRPMPQLGPASIRAPRLLPAAAKSLQGR